MTENVAALHHNFVSQTALVSDLVAITSLIRLDLFGEVHTLPGAAQALTLDPSVALLVNTPNANFDDTAITHANLRALTGQLGAISVVSSQERAPHRGGED